MSKDPNKPSIESSNSLKEPSRAQIIENSIDECKKEGGRTLKLVRLGLEEVPESIRSLTNLRELDLHSNQLTRLPEWIGELSELRILEVWDNPLFEGLPKSMRRLEKLEMLRFRDCSLAVIDEVIGELPNLEEVGIAHVGLKTVPSWIRQLKKLRILHLFGNKLTELPPWLNELRHLERLAVENNELKSLPSALLSLPHLRWLEIKGNSEILVPPEISKSHEAKKILDYYFRTVEAGAAQPLNEFKLILVGRGGVGKTTLVHRLITDKYKKFDRTPGIKITKWPVQIENDHVRAHVWDFGGQEIMHGTHRFFMTERALYLILLSGREGTEDHDADYWLSLVRSFAGGAPVLVLMHKWSDFGFELNRELLREKFGRDLMFVDTDSESGHGIGELRELICKHAKALPGLKAAWPLEWRRIKDELPSQKKNWLTYNDFCLFCQERGILNAKDQEALAESLHDLGLMLSYRKEEALRGFGILNPRWATKGIYTMLNSRELRDSAGKFTLKNFANVLSKREYPAGLHPYLLALMQKFRLCHPLDDRGENYLIPELLTKKEPKVDSEFLPEKCLGFIYRYDSVLPEGLLPRFIVETYILREPKHAWRTGVVLERANCRALIRGDVQGRRITVRVAGVGTGRRELLGIIREHFERIHASYEKLPVTEMVPIPGHPDAHVKHELLLKYERSGRDQIPIEIGTSLKDFSVNELLDGVDIPGVDRGRPLKAIDRFDPQSSEPSKKGLSLFVSYAHKDERFRDAFRAALTAYERKGDLVVWDDTRIVPGQKWEPEILRNLEHASIIVLMLSNDFIRSDYCMQKEMRIALERDAAGTCAIVPIVVRACAFGKLEIGRTQAILPNGKPIKQHRDRDVAWLEVTRQLDRVIGNLRSRESGSLS